MATESITSFDDLIGLLDRNPEYRSRLRQAILDEEFQRLPEHVTVLTEQTRILGEVTTSLAERMDQLTARVDQLTERMDQLTERMDQLTARVDQLTERMDQLTERMDQLTARVDQLTERMDQLTERMDQLTERMDQLTARMDQLTAQMRHHSDLFKDIILQLKNVDARLSSLEKRVDRLTGDEAERRFRARAPSCFGHLLRRIRIVENSALADRIDDAIESGTFAEADREPLLLLDVVAWGRDVQTREERYLAAEVSSGIGETDILRAADRAVLLEKLTGVPVLPVVAGYSIAPRFRSIAVARQVQVVITEEPQ